ncbi:hypothetical protein RRF57_012257 [Xylaria bambusicola]|uniref:SGNH hydrolase-type esterase domain-containing protein n=1 Tax=Xylaria bambusicola TaxID=326684 RepID=A0AAN7Z4D4_9PEZI
MPLRIASLGSSFAAGPTLQPVEDDSAGRSAANYAHIVASRVGGRLTDLSVCGATLLHLLDTPQYAGGRRFAPQIEDLPSDSDVVLVLGGGNDIGYIGGIFQDTLSRSLLGNLLLYLRGTDPGHDAAAMLQLDVDGLAERYATVLDAIHAKAPEAYVLVVEYQAVLGPDTRAGEDVVFDADRIAHHREVAGRLLEATRKAALGREEWCSTVNVADRSEAHAIGAEDPWINDFTWKLFREGGAYHPKREGMYAIADLVHDKMLQLGLVDQDQVSGVEDTEDDFVLL